MSEKRLDKLDQEKAFRYLGRVLAPVDKLHFPVRDNEPDLAPAPGFPTPKNYYLNAIVNADALTAVLKSDEASLESIRDPESILQVDLKDLNVHCLHGKAAADAILQSDKAPPLWAVELFEDGISPELRLLLGDGYYLKWLQFDDPYIYRRIRLYQRQKLEVPEMHWRTRLSVNKQKNLDQLLSREAFVRGFDNLLPFPGLWKDRFMLGVAKKMLDAKMDEHLINYLGEISRIWGDLIGSDEDSRAKVDSTTVKALACRVPGISTHDALEISLKINSGELFAYFPPSYRLHLRSRVLNFRERIITLSSFFEDLEYLRSGAESIRTLTVVRPRSTLYKTLVPNGSSSTQYLELFLFVMRHLGELSPLSILLEDKDDARSAKEPNSEFVCMLETCFRAFDTDKFDDEIKRCEAQIEKTGHHQPDNAEERVDRRSGKPYTAAQRQCRWSLYLDNLTSLADDSRLDALFVRRSIFQSFFGGLNVRRSHRTTFQSNGFLPPTSSTYSRNTDTEYHQTTRGTSENICDIISSYGFHESPRLTTSIVAYQGQPSRLRVLYCEGDRIRQIEYTSCDANFVDSLCWKEVRNGNHLFNANLRSIDPAQAYSTMQQAGLVLIVMPPGDIRIDKALQTSVAKI